MNAYVFDFDDFGCDYVISDMCQSHDCRDKLDQLHYANPNFKVTLFAIPAQMTLDLLEWCRANASWVELAVHGWAHTSNYEASEWTYADMEHHMTHPIIETYFTKGFKAPGWQISNDALQWLADNGWWVADQNYNDERRPGGLKAYVIRDEGFPKNPNSKSAHGHTWSCMDNGIDECFEQFKTAAQNAEEFKFVSEVVE